MTASKPAGEQRLSGTMLVLAGNALVGLVLAMVAAAVLAAKMRPPLEHELLMRSAAVCRATAADLRYPVTVGDPNAAAHVLSNIDNEPAVRVRGAWVVTGTTTLASWRPDPTIPKPERPAIDAATARFVDVNAGRYALVSCSVMVIDESGLDDTGLRATSGVLQLLVDSEDITATVRQGVVAALSRVCLAIAIAIILQFLIARFVIARLRRAMVKLREADRLAERSAEIAEAHRKLEAATALLRDVYAAMPEAMIVLDADGIIEAVNGAAVALTEYTEAELVGRDARVLLDAEHSDRPSMTNLAASVVLRAERVFKTKSGVRIPVLFSATMLGGSDRERAGMVCVALDIRTRKRLELELRQAQKLESIGRLAAGVAHEINTPVQFVNDSVHFLAQATGDLMEVVAKLKRVREAVVNGTAAASALAEAEAAEEDADLPYLLAHIPEAFARCVDGLSRVATIVRSMKEFAHPDLKQMAMVDLNRAIENTLEIARHEYKYVAEVETSFGELPQVLCHVGEINQAVLNIIVNAAHAIGDVVKGTDRKGRISIQTQREGDHVAIRISDTGGGIPDHIRERMFDPFFTTKGIGKGTGQGLAIARSVVVDKHKGELSVQSDVGKGTTLCIHLPLRAAQASQPPSSTARYGPEDAKRSAACDAIDGDRAVYSVQAGLDGPSRSKEVIT